MFCSTLLFRPGNLSCTRSNSKSMVALATSLLDKNNFIHSPTHDFETYLSFVVVALVHLDGKSLAIGSHSIIWAHSRDRWFFFLNKTLMILQPYAPMGAIRIYDDENPDEERQCLSEYWFFSIYSFTVISALMIQ